MPAGLTSYNSTISALAYCSSPHSVIFLDIRLEKEAFLRSVFQSSNHFAIWTWTPCHHCLGLSSLQVYLAKCFNVRIRQRQNSWYQIVGSIWRWAHRIPRRRERYSIHQHEAVAGIGLSRTYLPESDYIIPYGHLEFLNSFPARDFRAALYRFMLCFLQLKNLNSVFMTSFPNKPEKNAPCNLTKCV